ncbi:MAG: sigma-70 family RNA polymerase sigma factor [Candidatus Zixiibacteriota bacterium]
MTESKSTKRTDIEIWNEVLSGSSKAWRELIERYQPLVYTVATRAGLSMADASDCFQQTWVLLFQNRYKLNDPSRLSAWLVTTARREAIRLGRRVDSHSDLDSVPEPVDPDRLPDEALERMRRQSQLETGLRQLDERCRKLLTAIFFAPEDRSYEEVANMVGIAPNSMGPIRGRCLERLKRILVANGFPAVRKGGAVSL